MSIQNEIDRLKGNIAAAYAAVAEVGGVLPDNQNSVNMAAAIASIPYDPPEIYGAERDGSSTTNLTRTDDAALFTDPVPAVGDGEGSSPFDNIMPMSIQNEIDRITANISVAYTAVAEKGGTLPEEQNSANLAEAIRSIPYDPPKIYGAYWDGSSSTKLTRTDAAANFSDPVAAVGTGDGSSPFDNIMPWSGMVRVTQDGNELVAIPKYYLKVTHHNPGMTVQISSEPFEGCQVSPAHRDREDGQGERDVVYIGRYECDGSYMSRSGQYPKVKTAITTFRNGIHNLGAEYWQADYAMQLTWWFLYIVEFADWNSQTAIGMGYVNCGISSGGKKTGGTDSVVYHTGRASGADGQTAVQYRWIENPWGNVIEWRDGIIFSGADISTYNNPANFSDAYAGTGSTVRSNKRATESGWIKAWGYDTNDPSFIYPSMGGGSGTTFVPDLCSYKSDGCALLVGGWYNDSYNAGAFCLVGSYGITKIAVNFGSRSQKLPNAA